MPNQLLVPTPVISTSPVISSPTIPNRFAPTRSRPAAGHNDLPAIVAFYDQCEAVDPFDRAPSLANLQHRLDHPPPGGTLYRQLWETLEGRLVGIVALWIEDSSPNPTDCLEARIGVRVHPDYRQGLLEAELTAWGEQQVIEKAAVAHRPACLRAMVPGDRPYYPNLYDAQGYQPVRWFYEMQRSLAAPIPTPHLPTGINSRPTHPAEAAAWVEMFNATFIDHWHFTPMTLEDRQYHLAHPTYQPDLDWVAVATDGTLAGMCTGHISAEDNARKHVSEGWIAGLGTRRGYRRQGVARAMLLQGLHQLQAAGLETALIGVDSQNPNQAQHLYESVGFQVKSSSVTYEKIL